LLTKVCTQPTGRDLLPLCSRHVGGVVAASRQDLVELLLPNILAVQDSACSEASLALNTIKLLFAH